MPLLHIVFHEGAIGPFIAENSLQLLLRSDNTADLGY
jgi:hypothetical protein